MAPMAIEETSNFLATPHPNFAQFHCEEFQDHCILQVHFSPVVLVFAQIDGPRLQKMQGKSVLTSWIGSGLRKLVCFPRDKGVKTISTILILAVIKYLKYFATSSASHPRSEGNPREPSWITYVLHRVAHGVKHTRCQMITNFDTMERPMEEPQFVCVCVSDPFKLKAWNA